MKPYESNLKLMGIEIQNWIFDVYVDECTFKKNVLMPTI